MTTSPDSENTIEPLTPPLQPGSPTPPATDPAVPAQNDTVTYAPPALHVPSSFPASSQQMPAGETQTQHGQAMQPDHTAGLSQTSPYPERGQHGVSYGPSPTTAALHSGDGSGKSRGGALVAGIAIGALLGAIVGGGTAALVGANLSNETTTTTVTSPAGTITLNNTDSVNTVSAVAALATPSVVTIEVAGGQAAGSGSGVIYTDTGYIITNSHVATLEGEAGKNAQTRVRLSDGRVFDGVLVGSDPFADIAVIKIEADDLTPIKIGDSDKLNVGDITIAIGAPLNLANTVTSGVVSALYRGISVGTAELPGNGDGSQGDEDQGESSPWGFDFEGPDQESQPKSSPTRAAVTLPVIQTDASINPGNSGGALLNANGELIGINVAIASNGNASTAGSDGLGFAIPSAHATRIADAIIDGEQPSHGLFGASVGNSSQDTDADANRAGALLLDVTKGGAAAEAGLLAGDVVTAINGIPVDSGTSLSALVRMQAGDSVATISYTRDGVVGEVEVTLGRLEW